MVQRLRTGAGCGGGLRGRQAGSLPGRLGGRSGLGEGAGQRGRGGQRWGGCRLNLNRGADGGVTLRVAEAVRRGGAGRSGRQADRRRLTCRLVGHGSRLAVRAFGWDGGQLLRCGDTTKETTQHGHRVTGLQNKRLLGTCHCVFFKLKVLSLL